MENLIMQLIFTWELIKLELGGEKNWRHALFRYQVYSTQEFLTGFALNTSLAEMGTLWECMLQETKYIIIIIKTNCSINNCICQVARLWILSCEMAQVNSVHAFKANMGKMKKEKGSTDNKLICMKWFYWLYGQFLHCKLPSEFLAIN